MTNSIAAVLAPLVVVLIWADVHYGWGGTLFALRELNDVIRWLAFWR